MAIKIALGGKGGTGKTTVAGMVIRHLTTRGLGPVLAVDADPNANLADAVGLEAGKTIGAVISEFIDEKINIPAGMTKEAYLEVQIHQLIVEDKDVDFIAMGRGEGDGCYCFPNLILRKNLEALTSNYPYIVMDNEAGLEHLSRRTSDKVDVMLLVSDFSAKGVRAVGRIRSLIEELKLDIGKQYLVLNRAPGEDAGDLAGEVEKTGLELLACLPQDEEIFKCDLAGDPITALSDGNPFVRKIDAMMERILGET